MVSSCSWLLPSRYCGQHVLDKVTVKHLLIIIFGDLKSAPLKQIFKRRRRRKMYKITREKCQTKDDWPHAILFVKKVGRFNGAKNFFQGWRHKQKYNYKEMNKTGHYYLCSESCVKKEMYCCYFLWWIDQTFKKLLLCFLLMDRLGPFLRPSPVLNNISLTIQTSNLKNNTGKTSLHPFLNLNIIPPLFEINVSNLSIERYCRLNKDAWI